MDWITAVSTPAVHLNESPTISGHSYKLGTDALLVATIVPIDSSHLPARKQLVRGKRTDKYPFSCFRFACERLYGVISCEANYFYKMREEERRRSDEDSMVVMEVVLYRRDNLQTVVMDVDRPFTRLISSEAGNTIHKLHPPHRYDLGESQTCEEDHPACTDHIVRYSLDHARLAVSSLNSKAFHTHNGLVGDSSLPILLAMMYPENMTTNSSLYSVLQAVAVDHYERVRVMSVDVSQYHHWTNRIVPKHYSIDSLTKGEEPQLYFYPRFCIITQDDHSHAALYPDPNQETSGYRYTTKGLTAFIERYLKNPKKQLIETEQF